jgi:hypothetical protein
MAKREVRDQNPLQESGCARLSIEAGPVPVGNGAFRLLARMSFPNTGPGEGAVTLVGSGDYPKG